MEINPVAWFEIYVDDMPRAKAFYEAVFEVQLEAIATPNDTELEMWGFPSSMDHYGAAGALAKMTNVSAGGNSTLVYFACQDCAVQQARAKVQGGEIHNPKMSIGEHGFISLVSDTEGNMIGLHSMV
ncbi:VOC family protein [Vibrio hippocampi]|uniref:VOC domain-containing protein n=1 Tax=Vibrio hippocampi TaxID=654686 RepID=A0ABM8ZPR4_9VIBR|nr:VOC family protein [Vibrio hippocampi]CAH0530426.1 hypothetical protein VHP8226_04061 [Vibrio hippocampi]